MLGQLDRAQVRALHERAAAYYGAPFMEAARQALAEAMADGRGDSRIAPTQTAPTNEEIEALARGRRGVVGAWTHQTQDMARAHWAMERALAWQSHLFQAGWFDAAGEIVTAVCDVLARWGQRDLSKGLLRRSIETLEGLNRAVAQGNLAVMLQEEGHLAEALATYEQVYQTFAAQGTQQQMSVSLSLMSVVYHRMGKYDLAIEKGEAAIQIARRSEDEKHLGTVLHRLSVFYLSKEDHETALARSQEAEELDRKIGNLEGLSTDLHQQGLIFNRMDRPIEAFERFRESLEIARRIGDESGVAGSLGELGKLLMTSGRMREAITAFNEALEIYRRQGNPSMGMILEFLGAVHEMQGEHVAALEKYQQAQQICQRAYPAGLPKIERSIARAREKLGG
jgi:tetratricopeptide (TPR) repeat protein